MLAKLKTISLFGLDAETVEVEVDIHRGMISFQIVGLGDTAIQESKERVRSAIKNSGFSFPGAKISVNLAPADLKKHGPRFDVPIALGILAANGQINFLPQHKKQIFLGELSFDGTLRPVSGILPTVSGAADLGFTEIFVPAENAAEAAIIPDIQVYSIPNLKALCEHFSGITPLTPVPHQALEPQNFEATFEDDFCHIKGNEHAKRALEIAAAGGHNILLGGPPGSGKSMLAKSFATILPRLTVSEALDITKVHSIAGLTSDKNPMMTHRPFRSVHHTASGISIVGGGNPPNPGEISLAHRGVLFLDEFAEFPQKTLEVLRQPLEDGKITISRASGTLTFPAQFTLVAAMNPCPCGYLNDPDKECTDSPFQIERYRNKISGPLLDRIDLHIEVPRVNFEKLQSLTKGEDSKTVQKRVQKARDIQIQRFSNDKYTANADMSASSVKKFCAINDDVKTLLKSAVEQMHLSGRAYYRILKVARTIADLEESQEIQIAHVAEAIQYRERGAPL